MPKTYKLSNGEIADLTGIPEDQQYAAIRQLEESISQEGGEQESPSASNEEQPQTLGQRLGQALAAPKTPSEGHKRFYDLMKNLAAGTLRTLGGEEEAMKNQAERMGGILGVPEPSNFSKQAGLKPEDVSELKQALPGAALSFAIPNPVGRAGQAAGFLERGARLGGRSILEAIKDSLIASQQNPENPKESATTAAKYSVAGKGLSDLAGSSNPYVRAGSKLIGPVVGGTAGYLSTEGQPSSTRAGAALLGAAGGHAITSGTSRAISGPRIYAEPAAAQLQRNMGPAEQALYNARHGAFERSNVPGTFSEKTGSRQHKVFQDRSAQSPEDIAKFERFAREQESAVGNEVAGVKSDIFNGPRGDKLRRDYERTWRDYNPELTKAIGEGYRQTGNKQFQAAERMLKSEPERAQKYAKMDPNSLEYLDGIHRMARARSEQIESYLANPPPPNSPEAKSPLFTTSDLHAAQEFDRNLIRRLERSSPNNLYKNTRREAEYKILGDKIEHHTPEQLKELFNNPKRMEKFQHSIRDNQPLIRRVNDLKTVLNSIEKIDTEAMAKNLRKIDFLTLNPSELAKSGKEVLNRTVRAPYNRAAVDLLLNPNSGALIHQLAGINNTERLMGALTDILAKKKTHEKAKKAHKEGPMLNINISKDKPSFNIEEI